MHVQKITSNVLHLSVLFGLWLLVQIFCYQHFGIVTNLEATKYIDQAHNYLQTGTYSSPNFLFYSVQILLLATCLKYNISFVTLVVFQMLVNAFSILCFYRLAVRFSNKNVAFISTTYFLIFLFYQLYNTYLFTESLFFSFSILYTYFLFSRNHFGLKNIFMVALLLALLYFTRPTGVFFIPATLIFLGLKFFPKRRMYLIGAAILGCMFFYLLIDFALGSGGEYNFLMPYTYEMVICGVPTVNTVHTISVPLKQNSIGGLIYVSIHNFPLFFNLWLKRLVAFFGIYRPYYSSLHNAFAQTYFYLIYLVIICGMNYLFKRDKPEVLFLLTLISLTAFTVMISCDEWHNRFILALLPFFLLLATTAIGNFKNQRIIQASL